jgi:response regulator RpfG family c-di-GMP phosphodiesterase
MQAKIDSALEITEDALDKIEMSSARSMHKEAGLLHCVGKIGAGDGDILKSAGQTTIESGIFERVTISSRDLGARIDGGADRLAICHTSPLEEIKSVLTLREEHAR